MLAGALHAPLFAAAMIYEMTGKYVFLISLFSVSAISDLLARRFQPGSAYTFAFPGMGLTVRQGTGTVIRRLMTDDEKRGA